MKLHTSPRRHTLRMLLGITLFVSLAMSLGGCNVYDDEYPDMRDITGRWELMAIDGFTPAEAEIFQFYFSSNGRGTYGYYQEYYPYNWVERPITWDLEYDTRGTLLYVYCNPNPWVYRISRSWGYLELFDLADGTQLTLERI